ncbi:MAG TPA: hypothetical protein VH950_09425 [Gaiellaceae bacterium]|jgi:hypothetical protein
MPSFTIAGRDFELVRSLVERSMRDELPDPLLEHYVIVNGRRFPPKQVLASVTGLDRADFTSHQARRILMRLGFVAARAARGAEAHAPPGGEGRGPQRGRQAAALEPYLGQWVALAGPTEVLVAADSPQEVLSWLSRHGKRASGMFRVPATVAEADGAAPA